MCTRIIIFVLKIKHVFILVLKEKINVIFSILLTTIKLATRYEQGDKPKEGQRYFNKSPASLKMCSWTRKRYEETILYIFKSGRRWIIIKVIIRFSREKSEPGPGFEPRISRSLAWRSIVSSMVKSARLEIWRSVVQIPVQVQIFLLKI